MDLGLIKLEVNVDIYTTLYLFDSHNFIFTGDERPREIPSFTKYCRSNVKVASTSVLSLFSRDETYSIRDLTKVSPVLNSRYIYISTRLMYCHYALKPFGLLLHKGSV